MKLSGFDQRNTQLSKKARAALFGLSAEIIDSLVNNGLLVTGGFVVTGGLIVTEGLIVTGGRIRTEGLIVTGGRVVTGGLVVTGERSNYANSM